MSMMLEWHHENGELSIETVRRVKRGETWDDSKRLAVFIVERWPDVDHIWIRVLIVEKGIFRTSTWNCHTEEEAAKWFNVYTELYGPPQRGEFLGFRYGNAKVSETNVVPPMSCGS